MYRLKILSTYLVSYSLRELILLPTYVSSLWSMNKIAFRMNINNAEAQLIELFLFILGKGNNTIFLFIHATVGFFYMVYLPR